MRGDQHVLISLFSGGVLIAPWLMVLDPVTVLVLLVSLFIGSLAPDADAPDAAIFHTRIPGLRGVTGWAANTVARFLPFFGYMIRYLEYYPLSAALWVASLGRCQNEHRGLLHSLVGVLLITLLTAGYLEVFSWLVSWSHLDLLPVAAGGFLAGCLLHLIEDSCTPRGVAWFFPFCSFRVRGRITTGFSDSRPQIFTLLLMAAGWGMLLWPKYAGWGVEQMQQIGPVLLAVLWATFLAFSGVTLRWRR